MPAYVELALGGFFAFTVLAVLLRFAAPTALDRALGAIESPKCWVPASIAVLAAFLAFLALETAYPGYTDHLEPNIASVSWLLRKGQPLYHDVDSADRYSLLYGPSSYLPYAGALWLVGGTLLSLKATVFAADVATLYFLGRCYRAVLNRSAALLALTFVLVYLFVPRPNTYLFQIRGDVLLLCAVAAGLYAVSSKSRYAAPIVLTLAAAFAIGAKLSGFLYFIPLYVRFSMVRGWRATLASAIGAVGIGTLPFLLPNVSLRLYLTWLREGARHPKSIAELMSTLRTVAALALPVLLISGLRPWRNPALSAYLRANRTPLLALAACLSVVVILSSKLGAGPHHLLPFIPLIGYECALLWRATRGAAFVERTMLYRYCWGCVASFAVIRASGGLAETYSQLVSQWRFAAAVTADVRAVAKDDRGRRVEMGYGEQEDSVTYFRPALVFANDHLTVDDQALNDMQLSHIELPKATIDEVASCDTEVWLIPKHEAPFALVNDYSMLAPRSFPTRPLFPPQFRDAFVRTYQKETSTEFFDVWRCRRSHSTTSP